MPLPSAFNSISHPLVIKPLHSCPAPACPTQALKSKVEELQVAMANRAAEAADTLFRTKQDHADEKERLLRSYRSADGPVLRGCLRGSGAKGCRRSWADARVTQLGKRVVEALG